MNNMESQMSSGLLCSECGLVVDGKEPGSPRKCDECKYGDGEPFMKQGKKLETKQDEISK